MRKNSGESNQHKEAVVNYLKQLENEGWKTINLKGKSPDGIAIKNNKIVAIELLGYTYRNGKGWHSNKTIKNKKSDYSMFDDVFIKSFKRNEEDAIKYANKKPNIFDRWL